MLWLDLAMESVRSVHYLLKFSLCKNIYDFFASVKTLRGCIIYMVQAYMVPWH